MSSILAAIALAAATLVTTPVPTQLQPQSQASLPPGVPYAAPTDPVRIAQVEMSSEVVAGGDLASARILTTSNAAAMLARVGSYQVNVPRVDIGTFELAVRVPKLPLPSYRAHIVIIAIRADGATAQQTVSVKVSY